MSVKTFAEAVKEGVTRYTRTFGIEQAEAEETEFATKAEIEAVKALAEEAGMNLDTIGIPHWVESGLPKTNPAKVIVPSGQIWRPNGFSAQVTMSSTVANRYLSLNVCRNGTEMEEYVCATASPAFLKAKESWEVTGTFDGVTAEMPVWGSAAPDGLDGTMQLGAPPVILFEGNGVGLEIVGHQTGDELTEVSFSYERLQ